jgi:AcrR family transcriptional regulator
MPTETFYRLPDDKRCRLVSAIKAEFSRVPFNEVSINKIIQTADIPRGSFYQYFKGKDDMLSYILEDYSQQMLEHVKNSLQNSGGNIFTLFEDIIDFTIKFGTNEKTIGFCKNLFADLKINCRFYFNMADQFEQDKAMEWILTYINMSLLDIETGEDFAQMFEILLTVTRDATVSIFSDLSRTEEIRSKHRNMLSILKRGLSKRKVIP